MNILRTTSGPSLISSRERAALCLAVCLFITVLAAPQMMQAQSSAPEQTSAPQAAGPQSGGPQSFPGHQRDPLAIYREAGINNDQESQIRQFAKEFEDANAVRLQSVMNLLQEMKTLSLKPDPDEQAVISKQEQISKIQADMAMERIKLLLKIRHLLTADQKQRLVELMQKNAGAPASSN